MSKLIPVTLNKILQSRTYTVITLSSEHKKFAIYTEPSVGKNLQLHLTKVEPPRPYTHDLLAGICTGLGIKLLQIVINDIEDTIYFARLFLEQQTGSMKQIIEIDARPSDCLILAILNEVPIFCRSEVLEQAIEIDTP